MIVRQHDAHIQKPATYTEGEIEDNVVRSEMGTEVALCGREVALRLTP